jgi:hypothetical protein
MATTATTRVDQETAFPPTLFVAFDGSEQMEAWLHHGGSAAAIRLDGGWLEWRWSAPTWHKNIPEQPVRRSTAEAGYHRRGQCHFGTPAEIAL